MYSVAITPYKKSKALLERHKALRKKLKLSQTELAERSGVSLGSLKRLNLSGKFLWSYF